MGGYPFCLPCKTLSHFSTIVALLSCPAALNLCLSSFVVSHEGYFPTLQTLGCLSASVPSLNHFAAPQALSQFLSHCACSLSCAACLTPRWWFSACFLFYEGAVTPQHLPPPSRFQRQGFCHHLQQRHHHHRRCCASHHHFNQQGKPQHQQAPSCFFAGQQQWGVVRWGSNQEMSAAPGSSRDWLHTVCDASAVWGVRLHAADIPLSPCCGPFAVGLFCCCLFFVFAYHHSCWLILLAVILVVSHSKHCFLAPSSKLCQNWLRHWRGTLYRRAAIHQCGQHPPKGLGTSKTVEAT